MSLRMKALVADAEAAQVLLRLTPKLLSLKC
jgi:hypothetical protein